MAEQEFCVFWKRFPGSAPCRWQRGALSTAQNPGERPLCWSRISLWPWGYTWSRFHGLEGTSGDVPVPPLPRQGHLGQLQVALGCPTEGDSSCSRALPPSWKEVLPHVGLELEVYFMAMALCPVIVTTEQSGTILLTIFSGLRKKFLDGNVFSSSLWGNVAPLEQGQGLGGGSESWHKNHSGHALEKKQKS